ncbi:hypothetical protein [Planococcus lenghuensis]|uniref:Uncharacterized protein n=1 Tax=Planococcus lenghuensis TaxID=2213202 RepID=A0A1Q2L2S3_9BACL|nr:hypothetical protein [Planococcus lenghuensis]AQQ54755.1 hypothetical protein B0X71_17705 [Planococcus lenghuensis]
MNHYNNENRIDNTWANQEQHYQNESFTPVPHHNFFQYPQNFQNDQAPVNWPNGEFFHDAMNSDQHIESNWYKPQKYSNWSIGVEVGNDLHQVFVYQAETAKNELVDNSLTNDCGFKTSPSYYMYCTEDNMKFRSKPEVHIYFALKERNVLFYANSSVTVSSERKEPDFSVIFRGRIHILDVLSDKTHTSEKDAAVIRFYQNHGIPMRSYSAEDCEKNPYGVVDDFLNWIKSQ